MPNKSIDDLLSDLEGAEKTAEEVFASEIAKEDEAEETVASDEEVTKEAEETETETEEEAAEKTAETEEEEEVEEKTAEEVTEDDEETEEKTASEETEEEDVEEKTASTENLAAEDLVKIAKDMGKVMAHSAYAELVAMGIMPATNDDVEIPPISQVSMPMNSPVTVAADAKEQMKGEGQEKKASTVNEQVLTNLYNNYFPEEEQ